MSLRATLAASEMLESTAMFIPTNLEEIRKFMPRINDENDFDFIDLIFARIIYYRKLLKQPEWEQEIKNKYDKCMKIRSRILDIWS